METYEKITEKQFKVISQLENVINIDWLKNQRQAVVNELVKVDALIAEAEKLGVR